MKPYNKHYYPTQTIFLVDFASKMNGCLTSPFTNNDKLKQFYDEFVKHNYNLCWNWVNTQGYDTVEEWTEEYFKDWDFDLHSTILKSVFKKKYNNVKPEITDKQRMENIANQVNKQMKI